MEARVAKLEADVGHILRSVEDVKTDQRDMRKELQTGMSSIDTKLGGIRSDMRTDFYWVIGAFVVMLGLLAKGFHWI